jgi:hypothetical protein
LYPSFRHRAARGSTSFSKKKTKETEYLEKTGYERLSGYIKRYGIFLFEKEIVFH